MTTRPLISTNIILRLKITKTFFEIVFKPKHARGLTRYIVLSTILGYIMTERFWNTLYVLEQNKT